MSPRQNVPNAVHLILCRTVSLALQICTQGYLCQPSPLVALECAQYPQQFVGVLLLTMGVLITAVAPSTRQVVTGGGPTLQVENTYPLTTRRQTSRAAHSPAPESSQARRFKAEGPLAHELPLTPMCNVPFRGNWNAGGQFKPAIKGSLPRRTGFNRRRAISSAPGHLGSPGHMSHQRYSFS